MTDTNIVDRIDEVLDMLYAPVSDTEALEGWTLETKKLGITFFQGIKNKLQLGETLPPMSLTRALDFWGVTKGEILERTADISLDIRARGGNPPILNGR